VLAVRRIGAGTGSVVSSPAGIICGDACGASGAAPSTGRIPGRRRGAAIRLPVCPAAIARRRLDVGDGARWRVAGAGRRRRLHFSRPAPRTRPEPAARRGHLALAPNSTVTRLTDLPGPAARPTRCAPAGSLRVRPASRSTSTRRRARKYLYLRQRLRRDERLHPARGGARTVACFGDACAGIGTSIADALGIDSVRTPPHSRVSAGSNAPGAEGAYGPRAVAVDIISGRVLHRFSDTRTLHVPAALDRRVGEQASRRWTRTRALMPHRLRTKLPDERAVPVNQRDRTRWWGRA